MLLRGLADRLILSRIGTSTLNASSKSKNSTDQLASYKRPISIIMMARIVSANSAIVGVTYASFMLSNLT